MKVLRMGALVPQVQHSWSLTEDPLLVLSNMGTLRAGLRAPPVQICVLEPLVPHQISSIFKSSVSHSFTFIEDVKLI